jgi:hypothetical protein
MTAKSPRAPAATKHHLKTSSGSVVLLEASECSKVYLQTLNRSAKVSCSPSSYEHTGADCVTAVRAPAWREGAMIVSRIFSDAVFDPEALKALATAFDGACAALSVDRADPRAIAVAKKMIEHARCGERDPIRLREAVLTELPV